jgi:2-polyprenyl-3-methyl-5-hydroxy-6-metoxy-1,4-benzoquinol methylase
MNKELLQIINDYPLIFPRLYNYLRILILPITKIAKYVPEVCTVLDVGCGYGLLDFWLAKTSPKRNVIGSELQENRVKIASLISEKYDNVRFFQKNLLEGDNQDNIDCILMIDFLHHVSYSDQNQVLERVANMLPKDGRLIVKDMDTLPRFKYYWNLVHDKLITGFDPLYFIGSQDLKNKIESYGFSVTLAKKISHPLYAHYILVCEKN